MRTLTTERLSLEPLCESHAAEMFRILGDPVIYTFLKERPPFTEDEVRARYRYLEGRRSPDGTQEWLNWIVRDVDGEALGYVQATVYDQGIADVAYVLTPMAWGRGYAKEATHAMIRELGDGYGVKQCYASVAPRNGPSIGVILALGFQPVSAEECQHRATIDTGDLVFRLELGRV